MDNDLSALMRGLRADSTDATARSRFIRAGVRAGKQVIWRGGHDFDLISNGETVNQYFTPPAAQVQRVAALNDELGLGLTGDDFVRAWETIPAWPKQPTAGLVLAWYLPTVQDTFESGWRAIQATHSNHLRLEVFKSDPANLRLLPGIEHPGPGLRWEKIDFFANWVKGSGFAPRNVRNPQTSPHAGLLAAAALHPTLITSMDGDTVPYWWLSGYECCQGPRFVPWLSFDQGHRRVQLRGAGHGFGHFRLAAPSFVRE